MSLPNPAEPSPEYPSSRKRIFAPRKKRAFLSFRRKSDFVLFLLCATMLAAAVTLFVFVQRQRPAAPAGVENGKQAVMEQAPPPAEAVVVGGAAGNLDISARSFDAGLSGEAVVSTAAAALAGAGSAPAPEQPLVPVGEPIPSENPAPSAAPPAETKRAASKTAMPMPRRPAAPVKPSAPIELLAGATPWRVEDTAEGWAYARLTETGGRAALRVTYSLQKARRVRVTQTSLWDLRGQERLRFLVKGGGAESSLDVHLTDADGTVVGGSIPRRARPGKWAPYDMPLSSLEVKAPGRNGRFDRRRVKEVSFAVADEPSAGGSGEIFLSEVAFHPAAN